MGKPKPHTLVLALASLCASCTNVTVRTPAGETAAFTCSFGDASVDRIDTPAGFSVYGIRASHSQSTRGGLRFLSWHSLLQSPFGEILSSIARAIHP